MCLLLMGGNHSIWIKLLGLASGPKTQARTHSVEVQGFFVNRQTDQVDKEGQAGQADK